MTSINKKVVKSYLKEVSSVLDCNKALKSVFLSELREDIENFSNSGVVISKEKLYGEFGTPQDITHSFYSRNDYDVLLKKSKKKVIIWRIISVVFCILFIVVVCHFVELLDHSHGEVTVTNILSLN